MIDNEDEDMPESVREDDVPTPRIMGDDGPGAEIKYGVSTKINEEVEEFDDIGSVLDHSFDDIIVPEKTVFVKARVSVALSWENIIIEAVPPPAKCCFK